ncbi:hypothetical protein Pfo_001503 [Paulownia fortunei]|nr:hypothetical protein Pfo_001503 [Paulownia fortunei]
MRKWQFIHQWLATLLDFKYKMRRKYYYHFANLTVGRYFPCGYYMLHSKFVQIYCILSLFSLRVPFNTGFSVRIVEISAIIAVFWIILAAATIDSSWNL